jgi:hypothetical protein
VAIVQDELSGVAEANYDRSDQPKEDVATEPCRFGPVCPVSPLVNNVRNKSADLVAPAEDAATTLDLDTNPSQR